MNQSVSKKLPLRFGDNSTRGGESFRCYRHTVLCTAVLSFILTLFPGHPATAQERPDTTINHHPVTAFDQGWIARYYGLDWNTSGADGSTVSASESDSLAKAEAERLSAGKAEDADSYTLSLRANLLRWATLTPDFGLEWRISPSVGVMVNGSWTSWTSWPTKDLRDLEASRTWNDNARRYALWEVMPEVRWYLGEKKAWYVGAMFKAGQFNYKLSGTGRQGDLLGGGITGGYQLKLTEALSMDFTLALGYLNADTERYDVTGGVRVRSGNGTKHWIGPVNAGVTLECKLF